MQRFADLRDKILHGTRPVQPGEVLDVVDVGCGAGTQVMLWAEAGHRARGIDINAPLIELGRERAAERGLAVELEVGTATALPWPDASADVVLVPALIEHVAEWST